MPHLGCKTKWLCSLAISQNNADIVSFIKEKQKQQRKASYSYNMKEYDQTSKKSFIDIGAKTLTHKSKIP